MEEHFYRKFLKMMLPYLEYRGIYLKKETKLAYIYDFSAEDIVIPKKQEFTYPVIFFAKDRKIVDKFEYRGAYWRSLYSKFKDFTYKRAFENIARYDGI